MDVKTIHIAVTEEEHREMKDRKGDRTWREVLEDGLE